MVGVCAQYNVVYESCSIVRQFLKVIAVCITTILYACADTAQRQQR
jgi:hypothetical protein